MKKGVLITLIVVGVVLVLIVGFFMFANNGNNSSEQGVDTDKMVDCGMMTNPSCFSNRMQNCLPVTTELTATDGTTKIDLTILGFVNETCHFQRKVSNVLNLDCYFPSGALNWDLVDQTFGNDKGLQSIVDSSCTNV